MKDIMKNSLLLAFVVLLVMLTGANAMQQKVLSTEKMRELYLDFFNADAYNLSFFDTSAWGNRTWDPENHYYVYETGIRVEDDYPETSTTVTFPDFTPIRIESGWRDSRFNEECPPARCPETTQRHATAPESTSSFSSMSSSNAQSTSSESEPSQKSIDALYQQYQRDGIVNAPQWGITRRYNDELTAYEFMETGIRVDSRLGVVFFPGHQAGLPFEQPSNTIARVMRTEQSDTHIILRDIIVFLCVAALWYYVPSRS